MFAQAPAPVLLVPADERKKQTGRATPRRRSFGHREISCQLVELVTIRRLVRATDPLRKLLERQTSVDRVVPEDAGDGLTVGIRRPYRWPGFVLPHV